MSGLQPSRELLQVGRKRKVARRGKELRLWQEASRGDGRQKLAPVVGSPDTWVVGTARCGRGAETVSSGKRDLLEYLGKRVR